MSQAQMKIEIFQPTIMQFSNYELLASQVAHDLFERIQRNPRLNLVLPTGRSAIAIYKAFSALCLSHPKLDLSKIHTFNLDEYVGLPETSPDSFHTFMKTHLFSKLGLSPKQTFFPDANDPTAYDKLIKRHGGIDLCLLGVGLNGHIAFNEPGASSDSPTRIVKLSEETRAANKDQFSTGIAVPTHAVSMGIGSILQAREILLVCNTQEKWMALAKHLGANKINPMFPASYILSHPQASFYHI